MNHVRDIDNSRRDLKACIQQYLCSRVRVLLAKVSKQDLLAGTDAAGTRLTNRTRTEFGSRRTGRATRIQGNGAA